LQESMKLMGLKAWLHWLAWFVKFAIFMIISVAFMTLFFQIKVNNTAVITKTAPSITFVFLLLYSLSIVTFCFAISTFFSKGVCVVLAV
jgi:ATP-binding cassette, subfamily A (ABC1), member 3